MPADILGVHDRAHILAEGPYWQHEPWTLYFNGNPPGATPCKRHGFVDADGGLCPSCVSYVLTATGRAAESRGIGQAAALCDAAENEWDGRLCDGGDCDRKHASDRSAAAAVLATRIRTLENP